MVAVDRSVPPRWSAALSLLTRKGEVVLDEGRRRDGGGGMTWSWKKEREDKIEQPAATSILSWNEFSRGIKGTYDVDADAKNALNRLSSLAVSIIPPECGLGMSCDRTLLEVLISSFERGGKGHIKDVRNDIEIMRGGRKVPDEEWTEAKKLVKKLCEWQQNYLGGCKAMPNNISSHYQGPLQMEESSSIGGGVPSKPSPHEIGMANKNQWPWLFLEERIIEFLNEKDNLNKSSTYNSNQWPQIFDQFQMEERKEFRNVEEEKWSNSNCAAAAAAATASSGTIIQQPSNLDDDVLWLYSCCEKYVKKYQNIQLSAAELASSIVTVTTAASDSREISVAMQEDLFGLLGETGMDFIVHILEKRTALAMMASNEIDFNVYSELLSNDIPSNNYPGSSVDPMMHIPTQSDIRTQKERRKEHKRWAKSTAAERQRVEELSKGQAQVPSWLKKSPPTQSSLSSPFDLSSLASEGTREFHEMRGGLPPGTTKFYKPGEYELVYVPIPERRFQVKDGDNLISINTMEPEWARLAFKGIKQLNAMQSKVYECAYRTSENMLVCAPTGAGKTNIAMLTLLQQFQQFANITIEIDEEGVVNHHQKGWCKGFKAVYVAPMKALAQEVVSKFRERLNPLGLVVKENTGDMQLSRAEVEEANLIVVTPEKWDVITRRGGDGTLVALVSLLIIDEVHLLAENRGAVIESIVARTHRHVETVQRPVRIIGLSATLPNYQDVGTFLRARPSSGLFYFGPEYRPVPLEQTFIGIIAKQRTRQQMLMMRVTYERALQSVREGNQVMVFVHARKDTVRTAEGILDLAARDGTCEEFSTTSLEAQKKYSPAFDKCSAGEIRVLYGKGFGCHHAGMPRRDRQLTERAFTDGAINLLVCTATLAWGVNLPVHTVIIKGTEVYNPEKGGIVDLSILDVFQIFGRAGRPQFDTSGEAILVTSHSSFDKYLSLLTRQTPIESTFINSLPDHLNAEVSSGAVTNIEEASNWLTYTYLYVRMRKNPLVYGIGLEEVEFDPQVDGKRRELIHGAAATLDEHRMIRFDLRSGNLASTDLGRIASLFYINHESIYRFSTSLKPHMTPAKALATMCLATEFEQIKVRPEEIKELDKLKVVCPMAISVPVTESNGKVNVLLQAYISSKLQPKDFALLSDMLYIAQNAARIARALFEIALKKGWSSLAYTMLRIAKSIDRRMWWFQSPLRQFTSELPSHVLRILDEFESGEKTSCNLSANALLDMGKREIGELVHCSRMGDKILNLACFLPSLSITTTFQPITRSILKATISIKPNFKWVDKWHKGVEPWWIWVEDDENERIYYSTKLLLHPKDVYTEHTLTFCVPVFDPMPSQYWIRAISDKWVGCSHVEPVPFDGLVLPSRLDSSMYTELLDLRPLPVQALHDSKAVKFVFPGISHFNPIQTQLFHVLYHSNEPVLIGAPTGSGKTVLAEIAVLRLFRTLNREAVAVYIAPLKALARERKKDWEAKFNPLGIKVIMLTGDVSPDDATLRRANIIITTPEKWDLATRGTKHYVKRTGLIIIDEVHLLGEDRGPVLEAVVSRARRLNEECLTTTTSGSCSPIRLVALSTALANPWDLGDWLGIRRSPGGGVYNFKPSVRPIPCEIHIQGFPEKHYCPRMSAMNKTVYATIMEHSPDKPALIFVASRRQTRLTAMNLIVFAAASDNPKRFLCMEESDADELRRKVKDSSLCNALSFGIGMHHAGLVSSDRDIVERLFTQGCLQVVIATSTLAWGVNFPAHLVVIKGAEYYDGKKRQYVDFPVTDILQMAGRAGRPQFDTHAVAVLLVRTDQKNFLKRFLYEPFPVESHLVADNARLLNLLNAEIASGSVSSCFDIAQFLTWTFLFRRLLSNPSFYNLQDTSPSSVETYLLDLVDKGLQDLEKNGCVKLDRQGGDERRRVYPTPLGKIASRYYIDYRTMEMGHRVIMSSTTTSLTAEEACFLVTNAKEFAELPVRHNEENLCSELASQLRWHISSDSFDSPHTKAFILLQAYFEGCPLPISDFHTDTLTVFDQVGRVLGALVDAASELGHLGCALGLMKLNQMLSQAKWDDCDPLTQIPGITSEQAKKFGFTLSQLVKEDGTTTTEANASPPPSSMIVEVLRCIIPSSDGGQQQQRHSACRFLSSLPNIHVSILPSTSVVENSINLRIWKEGEGGRDPMPSVGYMKRGEGRGLGWWIFVGCKATNELLALKKISKSIYRYIVVAIVLTE